MVALYAACGSSFADVNNAILQAAHEKQSSFVEELRTLVNIDSGTGYKTGLAQIEDFLAKRLITLGAKVETFDLPSAVGKTVVGTWQGNGTVNIMMMIHYDTVFEPGGGREASV